ncbi:hypothetical protein UlMin_007873 [Ulmus minor]
MKSSGFMDKQITELSRSHSDDIFEHSYFRDRETDDDDDPSFVSKDDFDSNFQFDTRRPVVSQVSYDSSFWNSSFMDYTDPVKDGSKKVGISMINHKVKDHFDALLSAAESLSARLCQLESRTRKMEHSVDELMDSCEYNHGRTEVKLRELENILVEVQCGIQDLRDKQEISEVQIELAKLQMAKSLQQSEDQKSIVKNKTCSDQSVLSYVQQQSNQSNPIPVTSPQQFSPYCNVPPILNYPNLPPAPNVAQLPTPLPAIHSILPMQFPNSPHQQYYMPPIQQPQPQPQPPPAAPSQPVPQLPLFSQLQQLPISSSHNEEMCYLPPSQGYNTNIPNPGQPIYFGSRSSEFLPGNVQPSRHSSFHDVYPQPGYPSHNSSPRMESSQVRPFSSVLDGKNRISHPPVAKELPRALPMASNVESGSDSGGNRKSIPADDVIDEIVAMGFRRDMVRATVNRMAEKGQSVELNVVLDKLMNYGQVQPEGSRFGR